jgi:hypothetical protein
MTRSKWVGVALLVVAAVGALLFGPRALGFRRDRLEHLEAGSSAIAKSEALLGGQTTVDDAHREEFEEAMAEARMHAEMARENTDDENQALKMLAVVTLVAAAGSFLTLRRARRELQPQG